MWANLGLIFGRARDVATTMAATTFTNLATLGRANAFAPTDLNVRILRGLRPCAAAAAVGSSAVIGHHPNVWHRVDG